MRSLIRAFRTHLRYSLVLISISVFGITEALAQWRMGQRSQHLLPMNLTEVKTFAEQTDINAIKNLLNPILVERVVDTPAHREVGAFLKNTVEAYGFNAVWDEFEDNTPLGKKKFRNLIATYDLQSPRRLVLACHYDSKYYENIVFKAAIDSAVPCALLLDLARTLSPTMNKRVNQEISLQLVFLDGEEAFKEWTKTDSIYGARHLAAKWAQCWYPSTDGSKFDLCKEIDRVDVFVLLDLLGASKPYPKIYSMAGQGTETLFKYLPEIEKRLKKMGKLKKIPRIFQDGLYGFFVEDDHIPFMQRGVPILHMIPLPFPDVWHTPMDNETALDFDVIYNLATILRVFVARYLGAHPVYKTNGL